MARQSLKSAEGQAAQLFLFEQDPLGEGLAVREREPGEEVPVVELNGAPQPLQAGITGGKIQRMVLTAGVEEREEFGYVEPEVIGRGEPDVPEGDDQSGRVGVPGGESVSEAVKGLAQVGPSGIGRVLRPEQVGEGLAAVGPVRLDGEVCEESSGLVGPEGGCRLTQPTWPPRQLRVARSTCPGRTTRATRPASASRAARDLPAPISSRSRRWERT